MDLILFGIQGSGKGTQARFLAEKYGFKIFETGAELRKIRAENSKLGKTVRKTIDRGDLVSNEIVMKIVAHFLENISADQKVLFDGLPRSMPQKETFDELLKSKNRAAIGFFLDVPRAAAIARMLDRGRADDTAEIIEKRLSNYDSETLPVIEKYEIDGKMTRFDGAQSIEKVSADLFSAVENLEK
jgi:adenylate kinase